jgi:hypothetical protein
LTPISYFCNWDVRKSFNKHGEIWKSSVGPGPGPVSGAW